MKKIKFYLIIMLGITILACSEDNSIVSEILDNTPNGAILRTVSINNGTFNSSSPEVAFSVTLEEQDEEMGDLLESVDVYLTFLDTQDDDVDNNVDETLLKTIPASAFTNGNNDLPVTDLTVTLTEAASALGLSSDQYFPGDQFTVRLVLNLTDGRSFTNTDFSSTVASGSFFLSPGIYSVTISCTPKPGTYRIDMFDSYGDGWQTNSGSGGDGLQIELDNGVILEVGLCSPYTSSQSAWCTENDGFEGTTTITIPEGTESATWTFPGDNYSEISFDIYGPDGNLVFDSGAPGATGAGVLPFVVCAD